MRENFPVIGIIGSGALAPMLIGPSISLGVELLMLSVHAEESEFDRCSIIAPFDNSISLHKVKVLEKLGRTLRPNSVLLEFIKQWNESTGNPEPVNSDSERKVSVLVARSPHGQAATWAPTHIEGSKSQRVSITPVLDFSPRKMEQAQGIALEIAQASRLIGVLDVEIVIDDGPLRAGKIRLGPSENGMWTIEGSRTSQFEQFLRALLDLPLGDPSATSRFAVSSSYTGQGNMYRPYLHLMARSPRLKFHQYLLEEDGAQGHVTALGNDLLDLRECVTHAVEYMSGEIDE